MREIYPNLRIFKFKYLSSLCLNLCLSLTLGTSLIACDDKAETNSRDGEAGTEIDRGVEEEAGTEAGDQAGVDIGGVEEEAGVEAGEQALYEENLSPITVQGCDPSTLGQSSVLMPEGTRTQIHPDAAWDGEAFWMTWNIPNEDGKFETWAGRFDCQFNFLIQPFAVDQVAGMNDVDPSITVNGEVVLVAWARDDSFTGGGEYNLSTQIATFDRTSGEVLMTPRALQVKTIEAMSAEQAKITDNDGEVDEGNRWMVNVRAHPEGGFVLSGSWGDPAVNSFRTYLVHLNEQAEPIGSAWLAEPSGRDQGQATLSVSPRGHIDLVWQGNDANGQSGMFIRSWRKDLPVLALDFIGRDWSSAGVMRHPYLGYEEGINQPVLSMSVDRPWIVGGNNAGQVTLIDDTGAESGISGGRQPYLGLSFAPKVITGYQRVQGTEHKVWRRPISAERSIELPEELTVSPNAAPYALSITHFKGGSLYLWAEGQNPNFLIRASLVSQP